MGGEVGNPPLEAFCPSYIVEGGRSGRGSSSRWETIQNYFSIRYHSQRRGKVSKSTGVVNLDTIPRLHILKLHSFTGETMRETEVLLLSFVKEKEEGEYPKDKLSPPI